MKTFHVKCPVCGTVNHNLYLEETEEWMECEHCCTLVHVDEDMLFSEEERQILPFLQHGNQSMTLPGLA